MPTLWREMNPTDGREDDRVILAIPALSVHVGLPHGGKYNKVSLQLTHKQVANLQLTLEAYRAEVRDYRREGCNGSIRVHPGGACPGYGTARGLLPGVPGGGKPDKVSAVPE